jgi:hypothetical protein
MKVPITKRARQSPEGIWVLPTPEGLGIVHVVYLPPSCPVSGNPLVGVLLVRYTTKSVAAEVVGLKQLVQSLPRAPAGPMSVEQLVVRTQQLLQSALGVRVHVVFVGLIRPIQLLVAQC